MIAIAARAKNNVIGLNGSLPFYIKEDLQFFKKMTIGKQIVMGRKTYENMKLLTNRTLWVLTNSTAPQTDGFWPFKTTNNINDLPEDIIVCGGAEVYKQLLPKCSELYLTEIDAEPAGDTYFPEFSHLFSQSEIIQEGAGYKIFRYFN